jgi:hypothetical protein
MTTANRALQALRAIDWATIGRRLDRAIAITITAAELLLMLTALAIETVYEHRQQIRAALVRAVAALIVAAHLTYRAGRATRQVLHTISERSCAVLPQQPVPAVAPITATLAAAREALERLVVRLYPQPVAI